jgi:hypothetical protein
MAKREKMSPKDFSHGVDQPRNNVQPEAVKSEPAESEFERVVALRVNAEQHSDVESERDKSGVKAESDKMEQENKKMFGGFSELGRALFGVDGAKEIAALYIESAEKFAKRALDFQAKSTEWAKDTPLAPLFEAQDSIAREVAELSADTARRLWRIEGTRAA